MSIIKSIPNFIQHAWKVVEMSIRQTHSASFTLYLFTKSDIVPALIPIVIAGIVAAPVSSFQGFVEEILWIWLHLLQFATSNQSCSLAAVAEDTDNKPDRPIPSGRMNIHQVRILRWLLVPLCFAVSHKFSSSVLEASVGIVVITVCYNEFGGGGYHWFIKNLLNGLGFGAFQVGATLLAGRDRAKVGDVAARAILLALGIYATTTHTQDFKDVEGDGKVNRSTVPLVYPQFARPSVLFGLLAWSLFLSHVWELNAAATISMCTLAAFVGIRFCTKDGKENDQVSFYWYNLWLSFAYALPGWYHAKIYFNIA
ncbi:UbiA prenyltransferase family [Mycena crocata]|nr:UbiA prenyltransferase family [Mycena crocata]